MIRKIRRNVFETNSSSTNNLTIKSKVIDDKPKIFNNGTLDLDLFYREYREYYNDNYDSNPYGDYSNGSTWTANTRNEKAALLFLYLNDDSCIPKLTDYAREKLGYTTIYNAQNFSLNIEKDRGHFDVDLEKFNKWDTQNEWEEPLKVLDQLIDIVNDDTKIMIAREGDN
jgi:hypothetical protein